MFDVSHLPFFTRMYWEAEFQWIAEFEAKIMAVRKLQERQQFFHYLGKLKCFPRKVHDAKSRRHTLAIPIASLVQAGLLKPTGKLPTEHIVKKRYLTKDGGEKVVPMLKVSYVKKLVNKQKKSLAA
jgi:hypothetical protein